MSKVRSIKAHEKDGTKLTPLDALREAIADIENGSIKPTKLVVLALDDRDAQYNTRFIQAGMSMSQLVALLEICKSNVITGEMDIF